MSLLLQGNCLEVLKDLPDSSIDSVVTDPPYGLAFMGKKWDYDVPSTEIWREVLRVLKPGGYLLSFGGTRTYHRMVVNIEDAGFEIRDQIQWLYGSGFPKSHDISKALDKAAGAEREIVGTRKSEGGRTSSPNPMDRDRGEETGDLINITVPSTPDAIKWQGFGTALKPANEPIVLARKPLEKGLTVAQNVLKYGTGGLNIDASRIPNGTGKRGDPRKADGTVMRTNQNTYGTHKDSDSYDLTQGRFPANIILDEVAAEMLDEQSGILKSGAFKQTGLSANTEQPGGWATGNRIEKDFGPANSGGASRFFYVAKASKSERNKNCSEVLTWENQDQNLQDLMGESSQLLKAISDDSTLNLADSEWNTILSGNTITDQFQKDIKFTISTVSKLITESRTSNVLVPLNINGNILDAIRMIEANGLSLVESAEYLNTSSLTTTNEKTELALGASLAVLKVLSKIKDFAKQGNVHSTVKPVKLMEYLIRLITPPEGIVLDPFMGSGTTGVAANNLKYTFIGIEMETEYLEIAKKRTGA